MVEGNVSACHSQPNPNIDVIFLSNYAQLNPSGISAGEPSVYKYKGEQRSQASITEEGS